jgi:hypothetical protein
MKKTTILKMKTAVEALRSGFEIMKTSFEWSAIGFGAMRLALG